MGGFHRRLPICPLSAQTFFISKLDNFRSNLFLCLNQGKLITIFPVAQQNKQSRRRDVCLPSIWSPQSASSGCRGESEHVRTWQLDLLQPHFTCYRAIPILVDGCLYAIHIVLFVVVAKYRIEQNRGKRLAFLPGAREGHIIVADQQGWRNIKVFLKKMYKHLS